MEASVSLVSETGSFYELVSIDSLSLDSKLITE